MQTQILCLSAVLGVAAAFAPLSFSLHKAAPVHYRQAAGISMAAQSMMPPPTVSGGQELVASGVVKSCHVFLPSDDARGDDSKNAWLRHDI